MALPALRDIWAGGFGFVWIAAGSLLGGPGQWHGQWRLQAPYCQTKPMTIERMSEIWARIWVVIVSPLSREKPALRSGVPVLGYLAIAAAAAAAANKCIIVHSFRYFTTARLTNSTPPGTPPGVQCRRIGGGCGAARIVRGGPKEDRRCGSFSASIRLQTFNGRSTTERIYAYENQ